MIWNKVKPNMGNYVSPRHELLFIATKGSCTPDVNERPNSVQTIERTGRHSEKPQDFIGIIETLYTYGNKIELFARKQVDGWEVFGNES
jgi:N6-adenosine-specific RNA methylase IME4